MKYRKKPVVIEAVRYDDTEESIVEIINLTTQGMDARTITSTSSGLRIRTLEGMMNASVGDYIIKGVKGELYPCKPDIFEQTYEKVE